MPEAQKWSRRFTDGVLNILGPAASPLRKSFALAGLVLAGTLVTVALPKVFVQHDGTPRPWTVPMTIVAGIVAAIAVLLDRVADAYDKRDADLVYKASESTAQASVSELNNLLTEAIACTFLDRTARSTSIDGLRRNLVHFAAHSVGPGTRATYYTLIEDKAGVRVLGDPQHSTTVGRQDMPARPWLEHENPTHPMWALLDAADQHPVVRSKPDNVGDTDWNTVEYDTFITIPVKARGVVFGVLSVNNSTAGAIGDAQRAVILSMARVMALTLAFDTGVTTMKDRSNTGALSPVVTTVNDNDGTEAQNE